MNDDRAGFITKTNLPRSVLLRFDSYVDLLQKWNPRINLVAPSTLPRVWSRHLLDAAQLWALVPDGATRWIDLGSGGGFPGLVIAMIALDSRPELHVTLVESDQRKAAFIRSVSRETKTPVTVLTERIESIDLPRFDVVSARALAPLAKLLEFSEHLLKPEGLGVFPKGANYQAELTAALANWTFTLQKEPSQSDPNSVIFCIGDVARV